MVIKHEWINTFVIVVLGILMFNNLSLIKTNSENNTSLANDLLYLQKAVIVNQDALKIHNDILKKALGGSPNTKSNDNLEGTLLINYEN